VDQLSLHASAVPTDDSAVARVSAIPELQRQIRFAEEECKVVLQRLVESEKQKVSIIYLLLFSFLTETLPKKPILSFDRCIASKITVAS